MHILIIDDDPECCILLADFFESRGFSTEYVHTGADGLECLHTRSFDLLLIDVRLPDVSGKDLTEMVRAFSDIPIILISAYEQNVFHMVTGLERGADDYFCKPINVDLLEAKARILIRRSTMSSRSDKARLYIDSYLIVDLSKQRVVVNGRKLPLNRLQYRLLALLVENQDECVPVAEIVEHLWGTQVDEANYARYVHSYISHLRKSLEPDPANPRYIVNEYGLGYCFMGQ